MGGSFHSPQNRATEQPWNSNYMSLPFFWRVDDAMAEAVELWSSQAMTRPPTPNAPRSLVPMAPAPTRWPRWSKSHGSQCPAARKWSAAITEPWSLSSLRWVTVATSDHCHKDWSNQRWSLSRLNQDGFRKKKQHSSGSEHSILFIP